MPVTVTTLPEMLRPLTPSSLAPPSLVENWTAPADENRVTNPSNPPVAPSGRVDGQGIRGVIAAAAEIGGVGDGAVGVKAREERVGAIERAGRGCVLVASAVGAAGRIRGARGDGEVG